jgi:hypothetical protein
MPSIADIETAMIAYLEESDGFLAGPDVTREQAKELFADFIKYLKT